MLQRNHFPFARRKALALTAISITIFFARSIKAGDVPTLDEIKSQAVKQAARLQSLYIETVFEHKLAVDPQVYLSLPGHSKNVILLTEKNQYAFKGKYRYSRSQRPAVVKSPWPTNPPEVDPTAGPVDQAIQKHNKKQYEQASGRVGPPAKEEPRDEWHVAAEEIFAINGKFQWNRRRMKEKAPSELFLNPLTESLHWGQEPGYLSSCGWQVPDLSERDEKPTASHRAVYLQFLFRGEPYTVAEKTEVVDGDRCVVLHTHFDKTNSAYGVSELVTVEDAIWLALDRGLAVKQRSYSSGKSVFGHTVARDFVEILPGLWFPKTVVNESLVPPSAPAKYRNKPMLVAETKLVKWVVNNVPDDLFDPVPRPAKEERVWDFRTPGLTH